MVLSGGSQGLIRERINGSKVGVISVLFYEEAEAPEPQLRMHCPEAGETSTQDLLLTPGSPLLPSLSILCHSKALQAGVNGPSGLYTAISPPSVHSL